jgi:putative membrane protein
MDTHPTNDYVPIARSAALISGVFLAMIAFVVPMDIFGMYYMFTVHMAQHLLLSLAAPPLLLLGMAPETPARFLAHHRVLARCFRYLLFPFVAGVLFNANIWIWHAPPLLQAMMSNNSVHIAVNVLYLLTGLLFWCPLCDRLPDEMHHLSLGQKLAYLFFSDMPMMLIGAGLTFSAPLYSFTMTNPPMHMTVTPADQQLSGLLMWTVGSVFLLVVVSSILFLRWMLQQEKEQQEREREYNDESEESIPYTSIYTSG